MQIDSVVYFNNCRNRDHVDIYGANAFFDLAMTGLQATKALDLPVGQDCVVATLNGPSKDRIRFTWYSLDAERLMNDENSEANRVFFGEDVFHEILTKARASKSKRYGALFTKSGGFKRQSVAVGAVAARHRASSKKPRKTSSPDEVPSSVGLHLEGATRQVTVNAYERSAAARAQCLEHHGCRCAVCDMSFEETYGAVAADYIHVHHRKSLASLKRTYKVHPVRDLVPVCPNCHAVIHIGGQNRSIEAVKKLLKPAAGKRK